VIDRGCGELDAETIDRVLATAFAEDVGDGDLTTSACVDDATRISARAVAREPGTVAGLKVFAAALQFGGEVEVELKIPEGAVVKTGEAVAGVSGRATSILTAERIALNFLQRMSGIATATAEFVKAVEGTSARILDTRKTVPGLRALDKYAVKMGGGINHRFGLFDAVLIKDNHIRAAGSLQAAVERARNAVPAGSARIQVECDTLAQLDECLTLGVEWILLDNMTLAELRDAVVRGRGRAKLEASGGVTLDNVSEIAKTGIDFISIGALTHSVRALDIGLDFD
jgi:nicotinate-nucleotide pyrophosphorylase (carboxylating)